MEERVTTHAHRHFKTSVHPGCKKASRVSNEGALPVATTLGICDFQEHRLQPHPLKPDVSIQTSSLFFATPPVSIFAHVEAVQYCTDSALGLSAHFINEGSPIGSLPDLWVTG